MPLNIIEDIKPVSELKKRTKAIFQQLHRTGRPIVVTVNGKPDVVLVDAIVFEEKLRELNLSSLLGEAEADVRSGRMRPGRAFVADLRHAKKIPR